MFAALVRLCGLSANQTAQFLGVKRHAVIGWLREDGEPPEEMMKKLYELYAAQESAAEEILDHWDEMGRPDAMTLTVAATDSEALEAGWPGVAAQMTSLAIAQATLPNVKIDYRWADDAEEG